MYFIQLNQLLLADRQLSIFDKVVYAALCTLTQFYDPITGQKNQLISQNDLYNFLQSSISIGTIKSASSTYFGNLTGLLIVEFSVLSKIA